MKDAQDQDVLRFIVQYMAIDLNSFNVELGFKMPTQLINPRGAGNFCN